MKTADARDFTIRHRLQSTLGIALAEVVIGMALVALIMSCLFATNARLLGMLREGNDSTLATQMIAERLEYLRTCIWDTMVDPDKLYDAMSVKINTSTGSNLPGVTETITMEPYINPSGVKLGCVRKGSTIEKSGTAYTADLVKVTLSVKWRTGLRERERQFVTVLSQYRN